MVCFTYISWEHDYFIVFSRLSLKDGRNIANIFDSYCRQSSFTIFLEIITFYIGFVIVKNNPFLGMEVKSWGFVVIPFNKHRVEVVGTLVRLVPPRDQPLRGEALGPMPREVPTEDELAVRSWGGGCYRSPLLGSQSVLGMVPVGKSSVGVSRLIKLRYTLRPPSLTQSRCRDRLSYSHSLLFSPSSLIILYISSRRASSLSFPASLSLNIRTFALFFSLLIVCSFC